MLLEPWFLLPRVGGRGFSLAHNWLQIALLFLLFLFSIERTRARGALLTRLRRPCGANFLSRYSLKIFGLGSIYIFLNAIFPPVRSDSFKHFLPLTSKLTTGYPSSPSHPRDLRLWWLVSRHSRRGCARWLRLGYARNAGNPLRHPASSCGLNQGYGIWRPVYRLLRFLGRRLYSLTRSLRRLCGPVSIT